MSGSPGSAEPKARKPQSRPNFPSGSTSEGSVLTDASAAVVSYSHHHSHESQPAAASPDRLGDEERYLNSVLSQGSANRAAPRQRAHTSLRLLDLPQMEESVTKDPAMAQVLEDVLNHYGVSQCVLTWRHAGRLYFMAARGEEIYSTEVKAETQLFNHTISRKLPIIVNDAVCTSYSLPDHICHPGFYSAVPLVVDDLTYIGTLCIVDAVSKTDFKLWDADYLVKKGAELVVALRSSVDFSKMDAVGRRR